MSQDATKLRPTRVDFHRRGRATVHFRAPVSGAQKLTLPVPCGPPHDVLWHLHHLRLVDTRGGAHPTLHISCDEKACLLVDRSNRSLVPRAESEFVFDESYNEKAPGLHDVLHSCKLGNNFDEGDVPGVLDATVQTNGTGDGFLNASYVMVGLPSPLFSLQYAVDASGLDPAAPVPHDGPVRAIAFCTAHITNPLPFSLKDVTVRFVDGQLRWNPTNPFETLRPFPPPPRVDKRKPKGRAPKARQLPHAEGFDYGDMGLDQESSDGDSDSDSDSDNDGISASASSGKMPSNATPVPHVMETYGHNESDMIDYMFLPISSFAVTSMGDRAPPLDCTVAQPVSLKTAGLLVAPLCAHEVELSFKYMCFGKSAESHVRRSLVVRNVSSAPIEAGVWSVAWGCCEEASLSMAQALAVGRAQITVGRIDSGIHSVLTVSGHRHLDTVSAMYGFNVVVRMQREKRTDTLLHNDTASDVDLLFVLDRLKGECTVHLQRDVGEDGVFGQKKHETETLSPATDLPLSDDLLLYSLRIAAGQRVRLIAQQTFNTHAVEDIRRGISPCTFAQLEQCASATDTEDSARQNSILSTVRTVECIRTEANAMREYRDALRVQVTREDDRLKNRTIVLDLSDDEDGEAGDRYNDEFARVQSRRARMRSMMSHAEREVAKMEDGFVQAVERLRGEIMDGTIVDRELGVADNGTDNESSK